VDFLKTPQKPRKSKLSSDIDITFEQYKRSASRFRTASDLMSKNVVIIAPEASLQEVAQLMGEKHIGSLIVMKYATPLGLIAEGDLIRRVLVPGQFQKDEKVEKNMTCPLPSVSVAAKVKEVAQMMITMKSSRLGVFDGGTLAGIITASDLVKTLPDVSANKARVDDFMTKAVVLADEEMHVNAIAEMLKRNYIGSVIIAHDEEPFGIFTERDLIAGFLATGKKMTIKVGTVCSSPLVTIPAGISVHRAAAVMALKRIRRLPVVRGKKVVGIITARDLIGAYAK
jgi:signal-transduction protein with cAMP-binding, CBS, and nucleotidyltransferase domain